MAESSFCVFRYTCGRCGEAFTDLAKGDHCYGELTARSTGTGQLIYIDALADPVFAEVIELTRTILAETGLTPTERKRGAATQHAYSSTCDLGDDGSPFEIGGHPHCSACGGARPAAWEDTGEHVRRDVPEATHQRWLALGPEQRLALVREKLIDSLSE